MPQALFHACQHDLVIAACDIDDAVGGKAVLGDGGREEIGPRNAPEDLPFVRAAMPALNSAAAAPSRAPFPPPAISCSEPSASPPPGGRKSISEIPKGSTVLARRPFPSIFSIWARNDSTAGCGCKLFP
jgi:hypothetical protein